jgi:hypothetical protein
MALGRTSRVALDSNCLSYLVDALNAGAAPPDSDNLKAEKVALVRIMLYDEWGLYVTPEVTKECSRIRNISRAQLHASWLNSIFTEVRPTNPARIDARAAELLNKHTGKADCRILAEVEDSSLKCLMTYDGHFISALSGSTSVKLIPPTTYWASLNLPRGTNPRTLPHETNPLLSMRWWRWE